MPGKHRGQGSALALTGREVARIAPGDRRQAKRGEDLLRALHLSGPLESEQDLGADGWPVEERSRVLRQVGDAPWPALDLARQRRQRAGDRAEQRCLAPAVGTADGDN